MTRDAAAPSNAPGGRFQALSRRARSPAAAAIGTDIGSPVRALLRLGAYLAVTGALMPVQIVAVLTRSRLRVALPLWYHRLTCRILGIDVEVRGRMAKGDGPVLFVANHVSYFDIEVLGSLIPGSFVAKAEVADWPLFGWLAKLQRTVFVARRASRASHERDAMAERLAAGDRLILFAEGTSGDGTTVRPFKSALLSVAAGRDADGRPVPVQPVSIAYTRLDGMPLGRYLRPCFAWYGDMAMAPHLWRALGLGRVTVVVEFHEVVTMEQFTDRRAIARHCYEAVARGVAAALAGRRQRQRTSAGA